MNNLPEIILEKIKTFHKGKDNSIKRKDLLSHLLLMYPFLCLTDRELRNIYCQLPVATCSAGVFWPTRQSELYEFQAYLKSKAIPLFNRYKMVAEEHWDLMKLDDTIQWNLF